MKKRIICIDINHGSEREYFEILTRNIREKTNGYVCFSNVHMLIEAYDDPEFAEVVNQATYAFPDGFPIAKSFGILHKQAQERIAGMDFLPKFLEVCNREKFKVGFIGSTDEVLELAQKKILESLPTLEVTVLI